LKRELATWLGLADFDAGRDRANRKYEPNSPDLTRNNFIVEGEQRYWLHGDAGCQVDVLGAQLEEVIE